MKLICNLLLMVIISMFTYDARAQSINVLDSLHQRLQSIKQKDTTYLTTLMAFARKVRNANVDSALILFDQAYELSTSLSTKKNTINILAGMGIANAMKGDYAMSVTKFNQSIDLARRFNNTKEIAAGYNSLGIVYKRLSDYPTSLSYYERALQLYDSINSLKGLMTSYENIGVVYDLMREPEKSMECFQKALELSRELGEEDDVAPLWTNIAVLHLRKKEYEKALMLFRKSLDYYTEKQNESGKVVALSNMGHTYFQQGEYEKAKTVLLEALSSAESINVLQSKFNILYNLAKVHADQGISDSSIAIAKGSKAIAKKLNSLKFKADAEELLSYVYEKSNDPVKALQHHKQYKDLQDSLFHESKTNAYISYQVKMEVFEKDRQIARQTMELAFLDERVKLESRWKWSLGVASLFLFIAGVLYFQKYRQRLKHTSVLESKNQLITQQKQEIETVNQQLETRLLRAQMNPHFIFNALSSIQHFVIANDKAAAMHYLSSFSSLLRQVLETSFHVNMVLKDEVKLLNLYLELEALRFDDDFEYTINIAEELDAEATEIPTMVVQPFVENAIHHGLLPKHGDRKLQIDISSNGAFIHCKIGDNGIGREAAARLNKSKTGKSKSRGISVTQQRLALLEKNHGVHTQVIYRDLKDDNNEAAGTEVLIKIPKQDI